ncbi:carbon-nitrogen hydrolase [Hysterangium stoloniferum]|nr:carbon-nitrogen hydrolase [Hysterangium stoloniferum]
MAKWKIGLVQMAPELGEIEKNTAKLRHLTSKLQPGSIDLLCLPEMILTGYTFSSAEEIKPYLEQPRLGVTSLCCSELAKRLRCCVIAGYPEVLEVETVPTEDNLVGYNSAVVYGPEGEWKGGYRKSNMFMTDKTWAAAGSGFSVFDLGDCLGRMSLGICMDLNPFPPCIWMSIQGPYELAEFALDNKTSLVVILCAWLDSEENLENRWDTQTLNYWLARLLPLWQKVNGKRNEQETIVVISNRSGVEGDVRFAGTSSIFRLSQHRETPEIVGLMTRKEEGVRIWEV